MTTTPAGLATSTHSARPRKRVETINLDFVEYPSHTLDEDIRRAFVQFGEEHHELCDRLFADDPDLTLA